MVIVFVFFMNSIDMQRCFVYRGAGYATRPSGPVRIAFSGRDGPGMPEVLRPRAGRRF